MGNKNTCCCVIIQIDSGESFSVADIAADGGVSKKGIDIFATALKNHEANDSACDEFRLLLLYGVNLKIDKDFRTSPIVSFEPDSASLNRTLIDLAAGGVITKQPRAVVSRVFTNVCGPDLDCASLYARCVLRECGVTRGMWGGKIVDLTKDMAICAEVEHDWGMPVMVKIEASVEGRLVGGSPVWVDLDAALTGVADACVQLSVALPPETEFAVAILFDTRDPDEAARHGAVYIFGNPPPMARLKALAAGPIRGLLRRKRALALVDVYQTTVTTNACGPHLPRLREAVQAVIARLGGNLVDFRVEADGWPEKKNKVDVERQDKKT